MHFCLQVPELSSNICTFLREDKVAGPSVLARLARTHSKFQDPALDALWYSQKSLFHLLNCLPSDAFKVDVSSPVHPHTLYLTRDLYPDDYERVHYYSRRIRVLGLNWKSPSVQPIVISVLWSQQETCGLLLPNLRELDIDFDDFAGQAMYPRLVCVPTLRSVVVHYEMADTGPRQNVSDDDMEAVLCPVAQCLEAFAFKSCDSQWNMIHHSESSPAITKLHSAFRNIQHIDARDFELDHTALASLSRLSSVKTLNIAIREAELRHFNATVANEDDFPALSELGIETGELSLCSDLLKRPGFSRLRSLTITQCRKEGNWDLGPLFQTIQQYQSHSELKDLSILRCGTFWNSPDEESKITLGTLTPLFSFSFLAVLKITVDMAIELDNDALKKIAAAWPHLRVFRLFESTTRTIPSVKLADLFSFSASCRELEDVTLRVDALHPPSFAEHGTIVPSPNVRCFNACTSPIDVFYNEVATIINLAFPSLERLKYGWVYPGFDGPEEIEMTRVERGYHTSWEGCSDALYPLISSRQKGAARCIDYT
ncbi:hypothetical protein Hypma_001796 [Hypsizygus marmoreus]|uniref:F-box domain-containing protein n=1 Tax=Hypsizygus marmoreus TaxID=39966 RepID=A0A369J9M8_HYPMA|nr:hypothetical protein Hypma_001796 [Hypsizygus marmoreus]